MAADAGSRVVCVTATRGEAGSPDPERFPPHIMAKIREQELDECLAILGVTEHLWLDYRDGTCADVPIEEAAGKLEDIIGSVRPDTILTFGPEGFTDHPDHKAVSRWLTEAHGRTNGVTKRRVHFATQSPGWIDRYGAVMAEASVFPPGFPPSTAGDALSIDAQLSAGINDRKVQALRAQASQIEGLVQTLGLPMFRSAFAYERYWAA
jgi:LmbE family N-acetylglucosaminyl deacetylase